MRTSKAKIMLFVIVTYSLSFICWFIATQNQGFVYDLELESVFVTFGNFMPSIVGVVFLLLKNKEVKNRKVIFSFKYFIFSLLLMPLVLLVAYLIGNLLFQVEFDSLILPIVLESPLSIFILIVYFIVLQGPLGEEIGWRSFLLNEMLNENKLFKASVFVGLIWAFWHTPKFFMETTIQNELLISYGLLATLIGYTIYTVCLSVIISWLFYKTNKNIVYVLLFHAMANFSHGLITILTQTSAIIIVLIILLIITYSISRSSIAKISFNAKMISADSK